MATQTEHTCDDVNTVKHKSKFEHLTECQYGRPKQKQSQILQDLVKPHIESFNYVLYEGLAKVVEHMDPVLFTLPNGDRVALSIKGLSLSSPQVSENAVDCRTLDLYPAECRGRMISYRGQLQATIGYSINGWDGPTSTKNIAQIPIMVKSGACNLSKLKPKQLAARGEEMEEMGGYFLSNGIERIIRMLVLPRRNFPMCLKRPSWKSRGQFYTEYGVLIRSVRPDQSATNMVVHYLSNGSAVLNLNYCAQMYFMPVLVAMKGLVNKTNKEIFDDLMKGEEENSFYKSNIVEMFRRNLKENLVSRKSVMEYIGKRFRIKLQLPEWFTDVEIGKYFLNKTVCIHLTSDLDKYNLLVYMTKKLYHFSAGKCAQESGDSPMFQEILLGGHLYLIALKDKLEQYLNGMKLSLMKMANKKHESGGEELQLNLNMLQLAMRICGSFITRGMDYFLATGNLKTINGNALMQTTGFTVVADKLNFVRYVSHFRSLHRGAFFMTMRTTAVRKLLPEAWGFICPVHTPDGGPCGLLNHLTALCQGGISGWIMRQSDVDSVLVYKLRSMKVQTVSIDSKPLISVLYDCGVYPFDSSNCTISDCYTVLLDGKIIGYISKKEADRLEKTLRMMKVKGLNKIPVTTEICLVKDTACASQYPGFYLFTTAARMLRPVNNLAFQQVEMIGTFEQVYMDICLNQNEAVEGITTHEELDEKSMLSFVANMTPFSDFNQSPRNMYQCQMGKQTMGTPCHSLPYRTDNKLYRIQTPQAPLVRAAKYDDYEVDNYPLGTNAVVAVISYTGYDMEDAMLLSKYSLERGFKHASVYKSMPINLATIANDKYHNPLLFGCEPTNPAVAAGQLDIDGLPPIGRLIKLGDPFYSYLNTQTCQYKVLQYKDSEPAYIDNIKVCGNDSGTGPMTKVIITLRINRNPIVGDKFASRHGQKGICSMVYPTVDMPFTESGMVPDIVFNPHGYPSRMTIGMMIESMANKAAARYGDRYDAAPFQFSEDDSAADYFGNLLVNAGYNYFGTERMYSGVDGRELEVDIFTGIVYYQRLRHMVSDKYQVRSTGPVDFVTQQPVKGRKKHGGVRFGEMERDSLIAHGTSYLLQDRLFISSDKSTAVVCKNCNTIIPTQLEKLASQSAAASFEKERLWSCVACRSSEYVQEISVPQVFKYLLAELAAMNIKVKISSASQKTIQEE